MAGTRQPTEVVVARGKKHFSQAELDARRRRDVTVQSPKNPKPPKWLPDYLKKEFRGYAKALCSLNIYHDLDADILARYVVAHHHYLRATDELTAALDAGEIDEVGKWTKAQHTYFLQCKLCGDALGMSVSSRCKLVVPVAVPQTEDLDPMFGD